ncbi:hypothetical protein ACFWI9_30400, partial [Streptomyces sp. NPDC127084]
RPRGSPGWGARPPLPHPPPRAGARGTRPRATRPTPRRGGPPAAVVAGAAGAAGAPGTTGVAPADAPVPQTGAYEQPVTEIPAPVGARHRLLIRDRSSKVLAS